MQRAMSQEVDDFHEFDQSEDVSDVDVCEDRFSKTLITPRSPVRPEPSYQDRVQRMWRFVEKHENILKAFGELSSLDASKAYLLKYPLIACDEAVHFYVTYALNLAMEERTALVEKVSRQRGLLLFLLRLAATLRLDPRECIATFFSRLEKNEEYRRSIQNELDRFIEKITRLADHKLAELEAEEKYEEEIDRLERLGPGGLDPLEVYEILPELLQQHFKTKDVAGLKEAVRAMPKSEACFHLRNCIDAGLWEACPSSNSEEADEGNEDEDLTRMLDGAFVTDGPVDLADYEFVETDDLDNEAGQTEHTSPVKKQIEDEEMLIYGAD